MGRQCQTLFYGMGYCVLGDVLAIQSAGSLSSRGATSNPEIGCIDAERGPGPHCDTYGQLWCEICHIVVKLRDLGCSL